MSNKLGPAAYVIPTCADRKNPPTFRIRPLTGLEYYEVVTGGYVNDKDIVNREGVEIVLGYGVLDGKNLNHKKTSYKKLTSEQRENLPMLWISQLVTKIMDISNLNGEEIKN